MKSNKYGGMAGESSSEQVGRCSASIVLLGGVTDCPIQDMLLADQIMGRDVVMLCCDGGLVKLKLLTASSSRLKIERRRSLEEGESQQ